MMGESGIPVPVFLEETGVFFHKTAIIELVPSVAEGYLPSPGGPSSRAIRNILAKNN